MSIGRILLVGAGGVGTAFARIAARCRFAGLVIADYDLSRAQHAGQAARTGTRASNFLDLVTDHGSPWACGERPPAGK